MLKWRFAWAILPYAAVCVGMMLLRSAWLALAGFHLALAPLLLSGRKPSPPALAPVSWQILLPVAMVGGLGGLGLWLVWPLTGLDPQFSQRVQALGLHNGIWLFFIIYFTLVNPFLEELYWRAAFFNPSRWFAPVDFLFAGYHLIILSLFVHIGWMLAAFVVLAAASWFWRQSARKTQSLLPAILSHLLADLSILLVLYAKTL